MAGATHKLIGLQQDVAGVDLDRDRREPLHKEQAILATVGHHGDNRPRIQRDGHLALRTRNLASFHQFHHVLPQAELVEVLGCNPGWRNPRLTKRLTIDGVAQQTGSVRRSDRTNLNLVRTTKQEEEVDLITEILRGRDRAGFVRLALHERVQRPFLRELGEVDVVLARHCGDHQLAGNPLNFHSVTEALEFSRERTPFNYLDHD